MRTLPLHTRMLAALCLLSTTVEGQLDLGLDSARHVEYLRSIKQFSEFVDRFNQDFYEVPDMDPDRSLVLDRKQSIILLFNRNDPRFNLYSPQFSSEYIEMVLHFSEDIVEQQEYLSKHSDRIKAFATVRVVNKGKPDSVRIMLVQEVKDTNLVKWVISGVEADFLHIPERDTTQVRFLSPVSHELGFMDLKKAFNEPGQVVNYTQKNFTYDPLSVFLKGISEREIVFDQITKVEYEIVFESGYRITLAEVQSNEKLPGWCILNVSLSSPSCVH
jgi:hypothetical protein